MKILDHKLSIPDSEVKKILYEYYKSLFDKKIQIPFRLHPVVDTKNGVNPTKPTILVFLLRVGI